VNTETAINKTRSFFSNDGLTLAPYYCDYKKSIELYRHDTFSLLPLIPDNSIDLIFTDPPYFLSSGGITCKSGKVASVNKGDWDKTIAIQSVHDFNLRWIIQCQRILKPNGTIWICGTSHNIYSVGLALQYSRFKILNDIVWEKTSPPPNLSCRYFTHAAEHIIWASKNSKSKHIFNYDAMREMAGGKQMKSVWKLPAVSQEEKIHGKHPTQKPIAVVRRAILASSNRGDLVLDPFCGSGTTGVVCKMEGRMFIGIDNVQEYLDISVKRLNRIGVLL